MPRLQFMSQMTKYIIDSFEDMKPNKKSSRKMCLFMENLQ